MFYTLVFIFHTRRIEEEYARLKEIHYPGQKTKLRSQSVDPTMGRNKLSSSSSNERSSPFQPYRGASQQQDQQQQFTNQLQLYQQQLHQEQQHNNNNPDPRSFHPAAVSQGRPQTGYDNRGKGYLGPYPIYFRGLFPYLMSL